MVAPPKIFKALIAEIRVIADLSGQDHINIALCRWNAAARSKAALSRMPVHQHSAGAGERTKLAPSGLPRAIKALSNGWLKISLSETQLIQKNTRLHPI
jgi:hypothetical protein